MDINMITPCFKCKFFNKPDNSCHLNKFGINKKCFLQSNGVCVTEGYCRLFSQKYQDDIYDIFTEFERIKRNAELEYDLIIYCNRNYDDLKHVINSYYNIYKFNKIIVVTDSLEGEIVYKINDAIKGYKYIVKKLLPTETYSIFDIMIMSILNVDSPYFLFTQTKEKIFDPDKLARRIALNKDNFIFWQLRKRNIYGLYIKDAIKQLIYQNAELYKQQNLLSVLDKIEKQNDISLYKKRK